MSHSYPVESNENVAENKQRNLNAHCIAALNLLMKVDQHEFLPTVNNLHTILIHEDALNLDLTKKHLGVTGRYISERIK